MAFKLAVATRRCTMRPMFCFTVGVLLLTICGDEVSSFTIQGLILPRHHVAARSITKLHAAASTSAAATNLQIGDEVGSGSYGTVHVCTLDGGDDDDATYICKRAWNKEDLEERDLGTKEDRCRHYFEVERHCFEKMSKGSSSSSSSQQVTRYVDTLVDNDKNEWMVFELLKDKEGIQPAPTLSRVTSLDWKDQHTNVENHHHLFMIQEALGLPSDATFADTLDAVLLSLLKGIKFVHSQGIVHRDIKPGNILLDASSQSLVLIDFGSAADMDPVNTNIPFQKKRIGLEDGRVALSPIYAAPELYIEPLRNPYAFDVYSAALIFCQLLFNYLDERTDAAFHQQIEDANWDVDAWLSREMLSKVRPAGLDEALYYLGERPGLWGLLSRMFRRDPENRISSRSAVKSFERILAGDVEEEGPEGAFLESILRAMDSCEVTDFVEPRALHYVASFRRQTSLGMMLSEATDDVELEGDKLDKWREATKFAEPGDVFVMDILEGGQAEEIGACEIGDRLQSVGSLPVANAGFEAVVDMLGAQPRSSNYVALQFDRLSERNQPEVESSSEYDTSENAATVRIVGEGAWSSRGRRKANEDTFLLHDIHLDEDVLLAGVFDGHGGNAASQTAVQLMPSLFTEELTSGAALTSRQALEVAWQTTCDTYRQGCDEMGECVAEYDQLEGIVLASTGSDDMVAGTTASIVSLKENELTVMNCGDSRTLLIDPSGKVAFVTSDHSPESEIERIQLGIDQGLDYSLPQCSLSKWWITCGDIQYAVARSLEGPYATSKGLVSDPDVTSLRPSPGTLIMATDGLFEVCGNDEVARIVAKLRNDIDATDVAKQLCSIAIEKGSSDNVSVVVVYLE